LEGAIGLGDDEVVGVRSGGVGDNGDIVGSGEGRDLQKLSQATKPHNIRLDDIEVTAFNQLAESIARELVLASGELDSRVGTLQQSVAIEVIGSQALLPPVNVQTLLLTALDQLDSIGNGERHIAVNTQGEIRANTSTLQTEILDVLEQAFGALIRTVGKGHLGTNKASRLGRSGGPVQ
jgi:hypothetical protein